MVLICIRSGELFSDRGQTEHIYVCVYIHMLACIQAWAHTSSLRPHTLEA